MRRPRRHPSSDTSRAQLSEPGARVLWIDDEVRIGDAIVRLLSLDGFDIECARTGSEGLRKAKGIQYAAIILDLRLPDTPGLAILRELMAAGSATSVIILTGFAHHDSAVAAMKLGAADYKSKPIFADDLSTALKSLVGRWRQAPSYRGDAPHDLEPPSRSALDGVARRLAMATIGPLQFVLLTRTFRRLAGGSDDLLETGDEAHQGLSPNAILANRVLSKVAERLPSGRLPALETIAHEMSIGAERMTHTLKILTGADFRECRRALRIRPAMSEVASSDEQIAQIAYRHGYQWPGQFDRDFKATLLVTPKSFRGLFRTAPYPSADADDVGW